MMQWSVAEKQDTKRLTWLERQKAIASVYIGFGSHAVMTLEKTTEFAWGLAARHGKDGAHVCLAKACCWRWG
uniref:Uncharacterized protein n=1 Tax=Oryza sativa subsp. japonica TaxID=39947 RepID=Q6Z030_ORYSJ|nr:hypothetical protein [Oryza sativa Japonica Group]BAD05697.1 hypothetical protein [Oryza sativa Japonica Group]